MYVLTTFHVAVLIVLGFCIGFTVAYPSTGGVIALAVTAAACGSALRGRMLR